MKSIILYNLYPKNHWRELTKYLLVNVPHDTIAINVSLDWQDRLLSKKHIIDFLYTIPKVEQIIFSKNDKLIAESIGFDALRQEVDLDNYAMATYMHSKGVTKPDNENIKDWVELMRYFQIDRFELCRNAFEQGYALYGVNLGIKEVNNKIYDGPYLISDFHFSGNFVSVNLSLILKKFLQTHCDKDYFGVEGFWGKLCNVDLAFCPHISSLHIQNHYKQLYPSELYKDFLVEK